MTKNFQNGVANDVLKPVYSLLIIYYELYCLSDFNKQCSNVGLFGFCSARRCDLDSFVRVSGLQQSVQAQDFAEPSPAARVSLQLCQV